MFRHYWVLAKFLITVLATLLLLVHMQPVGHLARVVAETTCWAKQLGIIAVILVLLFVILHLTGRGLARH